jgi:hypothetical protein
MTILLLIICAALLGLNVLVYLWTQHMQKQLVVLETHLLALLMVARAQESRADREEVARAEWRGKTKGIGREMLAERLRARLHETKPAEAAPAPQPTYEPLSAEMQAPKPPAIMW